MKTAICILTENGWTPVIQLGEGVIVGDTDESAVAKTAQTNTAFTIGDKVTINGRLYQGPAIVERLDGEDVLARAENGKLYRYNQEDQLTGVISKATDSDEDGSTEPVCDEIPSPKKFEVGDEVTINGDLYQGYGTVERIDEPDVLVRADNGKLYRYNPEDVAAGKLS